MKLDTRAFATATAGAGILAYAMGALLDTFSSWGGAAAVSFIFRVDIVELAQPLTLASLAVGLAVSGLLGGLVGGFVAWAYNRLTRPAIAQASVPVTGR